MGFQNSSEYCNKKEITYYCKSAGMRLLEIEIRCRRFRSGAGQV